MTVNQALVVRFREILPEILEDTPVTLAYLYGSMATGQTLPGSDVDIALVVGPIEAGPATSTERLELEFEVEGALEQRGIPRPDVRVIDDMPLTFRGEVATRGIRLYSRNEEVRVEFETRTWKEYLDFKPVARMMRQALVEDIREYGLIKRMNKFQ